MTLEDEVDLNKLHWTSQGGHGHGWDCEGPATWATDLLGQ